MLTATCPSCSAPVSPRAEFCPKCLGQLPAQAPDPASTGALPAPGPTAPEAPIALAARVATAPLATEEGQDCQKHPLLPASKCRQCSDFYCDRCLPGGARPALCLRCNAALAVREAPEKLRKLYRELWLTPLIVGVGLLLLTTAGALFSGGMGVVIVTGLLISAPFFVVAAIIGLTRSLAAAWLVFVFEVLIALWMFQGGSLIFGAVAALIPLLTVYDIFKIQNLEALRKAHVQAR